LVREEATDGGFRRRACEERNDPKSGGGKDKHESHGHHAVDEKFLHSRCFWGDHISPKKHEPTDGSNEHGGEHQRK
jgi:hypothetical protein